MGFFGFGKKKEKESETDKVFKQFGQETNDVKRPAKMTRSEEKDAVRTQQVSQIKKDQLLEKFAYLRKVMYTNPDFDRYATQLEDMIVKLKRMEDNVNKAAMSSVDNFILKSISDAINYCNRGNFIAVGACIDIINNLINDRYQCGIYYTDPKFCKFKLEDNRLYVEYQNEQSAFSNLKKRLSQLEADYKNPDLKDHRENIAREAKRLNAEGQRIKSRLDNIESQMKLLDNSLNEIITYSTNHSNDANFNIEDEFDDVMSMKNENEHDSSFYDKLNDKMESSHRKVSSSSLGVNDDLFDSDSSQDVDDNIFKL